MLTWEDLHDEIKELWGKNRKTLVEIATILERKYGFTASKRQYAQHIIVWKLAFPNRRQLRSLAQELFQDESYRSAGEREGYPEELQPVPWVYSDEGEEEENEEDDDEHEHENARYSTSPSSIGRRRRDILDSMDLTPDPTLISIRKIWYNLSRPKKSATLGVGGKLWKRVFGTLPTHDPAVEPTHESSVKSRSESTAELTYEPIAELAYEPTIEISPISPISLLVPEYRYLVECHWEIPEIVQGANNIRLTLRNMLTLTARSPYVEAMTCEDAFEKGLTNVQASFLDNIADAIESPFRIYESDTMRIQTTNTSITLQHSLNEWQEISKMLGWLCLAIRKPPTNGIFVSSKSETGNLLLDNITEAFESTETRESCWHRLFFSAIVVADLSNKSLSDYCLKVDPKLMLLLSAVEHPVLVEDGQIFMGYSTALIPIERNKDGAIKWHLETREKKSQLKVSDLIAIQKMWYQTDLATLMKSPALLGWSSAYEVRLGTEDLPQTVTWSLKEQKPKLHTWKVTAVNLQANVQSANIVQVGGSVGVTLQKIPNTLRFTQSENWVKLLNDSSSEAMIIYDTDARRAWLVPKLSVLHHMAIVYCKRTDLNHVPFAEPEKHGTAASRLALLEHSNKLLGGSADDPLTVQKLIMMFSINLGRIEVHPPRGREIYGYEFMDIIVPPHKSKLGRVNLERDGLTWKPLLKHIPCLFCRQLGDVVVAKKSCWELSPCNRVPTQRDLLAATISCINDISERQGNDNKSRVRSFEGGYMWTISGAPFSECLHTPQSLNCWNEDSFLQQISPHYPTKGDLAKSEDSSSPISEGVVVFGERRVGQPNSRIISISKWKKFILKAIVQMTLKLRVPPLDKENGKEVIESDISTNGCVEHNG